MPKPQSPLNEPSQENYPTTQTNNDLLQSHSLLLSDSCDTNVGQAFIPAQCVNQTQLTQPSFPHLLINPHVASVLHAQTPSSPHGDNQTQQLLPPSPIFRIRRSFGVGLFIVEILSTCSTEEQYIAVLRLAMGSSFGRTDGITNPKSSCVDGRHALWSLNKEISRYCSGNLYAESIKEDMSYMCMQFTGYHEELKSNTPYPEDSIRRIEDYLEILENIKRGP
ncbi:hypothetical protein Tco_0699741 [Tanacetum coccineum]